MSIRTAADLETLFEDFLQRLVDDPLAPHQQEVVLLPHDSALRSWLRQQLADRIGCAASLYTPSIREFGDELIRRLLGADPSGLDRKALTWRSFSVLTRLPDGDDEMAPLCTYLDRSQGDAMPLARRLAELFTSYQTYRPALLSRWMNGQIGPGPEVWQAELWRKVAASSPDRASLMRKLLELLEGEEPKDLPRRISLFGEVLVPPIYLDLLQILSRYVELTWYAVESAEASSSHPIHDGFGEDARQAARLRKKHLQEAQTQRLPKDKRPETHALAILQDDIRASRRRGGDERILIQPEDASLRIHDCHSPIRELEVLRDQLLDSFAKLEDLQPSDVLIVVPDLDRYASLIEAVFSSGDESQKLPCVVARDPREDGRRYLTAFLSLLETLDARLTAGSILELLAEPAIGRKAQIDAEALEVIRGWIRATHVRWGADSEHRAALGLPEDDLHTWQYGIDRLLMGLVAGDVEFDVDGVLPYAEATLDRASILGRFTHWLQALTGAARLARQSTKARPVAAWRMWLEGLMRRFMSADSDEEQMAEDYLLGELREMVQHAAGIETDFASIRSYVSDALSRFDGRGSLLSGSITVADFERLRFLPARVVACVGLNDDAFPRRNISPDFDLIGADQRDGDPDPRRLDKQLFLDTLLAAQDWLILTYNGRSQKDNSERAPSVAIDALLDACAHTFTTGESESSLDAKSVRKLFIVEHPLQPFSTHYFDGSDPRLFSYDRTTCIRPPETRTAVPAFAPEVLSMPEPEDDPISLRDLIAAWSNPSKFFCRQLGIDLDLADLSVEDIEPHFLNYLDAYLVSDRILELLLDGEPEDRVRERLRREGSLPAGALGGILYRKQRRALEPLREEVESYGERRSVEIDVHVAGRRLVGAVRYVTEDAALFFRPASKLKAKDLVEAWISHLALAASEVVRRTRLICLEERKELAPADDPKSHLERLVSRYEVILREPVLLFPKSSMKFAEKRDAYRAKSAYDGGYHRGDCQNRYVALLNRHHHPIDDRREDFEGAALELWNPINDHLMDA